ncbi:MAG: UDP-N-acetylmuramoyl-tripeptide--D-alanyl-D-alanine ligase [Clostridia bacterium]|nr:UDP-N-acetylmuramoyl-tripeptide--D-alanyl-D-alanine ligase [Clostridia bacterium]
MLKISDILKATGGELIKGSQDTEITAINTDTRIIKEGMLFVALIGDTFDGNDYVNQAAGAGAAGCVVSRRVEADTSLILVDDTTKALGKIAKYYKEKFCVPFVGITGSVGKTTTKDMISCALSAKYNVLKTQKNFNNHIGLPLTLLRLNSEHQVGVVEMGMSGFGEIDYLAGLVNPSVAVFTNIGLSHVEKLGSRKNILKAKTELLSHLPDDGFVVLCADDDMLLSLKESLKHKHIYYGTENKDADLRAENIFSDGVNTEFDIIDNGNRYHAVIPVLGDHNVKNALAAYAVARHFNTEPEDIISALKDFVPGKMRQNILHSGGITVINDCYNASPSSVEAGLKILNQLKGERKIAVLGDMLEMGELSEYAHRLVGKYVVDFGVDFLITVGNKSGEIATGAVNHGFNQKNAKSFKDNKSAIEFLDSFIKSGDIVLVKASRSMKLEEISEHLLGF